MRSMKGQQYYDENEFTAETHITEKKTLAPGDISPEDPTPPMMIDLDSTEEIVERLAAFNETHQDNTNLDESIQFLSNVFELHQLYGENGVDAEYGVGSQIAAVTEVREGGIDAEYGVGSEIAAVREEQEGGD